MSYVYIVECADHTFYTGYAEDVEDRINAHNAGRGAKYTRGRLPVKLRYVEICTDKSEALKRERYIKNLSRAAKIKLIETQPYS